MFQREKKPKRFQMVHSQGIGMGAVEKIMVDTQTGVHYLVAQSPYGGITPLLDEQGNVVINKMAKYDNE